MSELNSYQEECQRAELLGIAPPDQAEFERNRKARLEQELAEQEAAEAVLIEQQDESLGNVGGKLGELNSILSSTQQKLNRFKQTACGSLSNIFARTNLGSVDVPQSTGDSTNASKEPEPVQEQPQPQQPSQTRPLTREEIQAAKAAKEKRMDSQLDKLDSLINKADNAHIAMGEQTKQMRRMAK
ncbi:uncharacterized protein Dwil_GK20150 [Drosophila willistoni]|uniref:t-SNARE coiled-coil homology domain-containing protein n=2 Tax=Drosophila willistoni TaxID=7260 RepID=B4MTF4_DROWI|nr:uncharacterized protein Dwil_GK20150 [Drosophila willistoni]